MWPENTTENRNNNNIINKNLLTLDEINQIRTRKNMIMMIILILVYFTIGMSIYNDKMGWSPLDCMYFITTTFTSVGYGDLVPRNENEMLFTAFFAFIGVCFIGGFLSILVALVMEIRKKSDMKKALEMTNRVKEIRQSLSGGVSPMHPRSSNDHITSAPANDSWLKYFSLEYLTGNSIAVDRNWSYLEDAYRDFYITEIRNLNLQLRFNLITVILITVVGACIMGSIEDWSFYKSFYWSCITITTIGYGDVVASSSGGKVFTIIYALFGCVYMAKCVSDIAQYPIIYRLKISEMDLLLQFGGTLSKQKLEAIFDSELFQSIPNLQCNPQHLQKSEFILLVLQLMNKLEEKDILLVSEIFDRLDGEKKGYLANHDMRERLQNAPDEKPLERERESILDSFVSLRSTSSGLPFTFRSSSAASNSCDVEMGNSSKI